MKNTIRCCISCMLPCGSFDVIRVVHANGRVEEITGTVLAGDYMEAHPKYVLKKPSSPSDEGIYPKIMAVSPDAELQRGKIYFLIPVPEKSRTSRSTGRKKKKKRYDQNSISTVANDILVSDQYLSEILSEKVSPASDRRRGRAGVWRPHLESICEATSDC